MADRCKILIVEDEPVVRHAAAKILRREGFEVEFAVECDTALEKLTQGFPVVLCDLKLPGYSGIEIVTAARDLCPESLIVMITGYATFENAIRAFHEGAFDFVPKPFDVAELLGVVFRAEMYREISAGSSRQSGRSTHSGGTGGSGIYRMGGHSWVTLNRDGSATIGAGETFAGTLGEIVRIELPDIDEQTVQGKEVACLTAVDETVHRVWAPLSGRVLTANDRLAGEPDLLSRAPFGDGWLVRIVPARVDEEISILSIVD